MSEKNPALKLMNEIVQKHNFIETMKNTYGIAILVNGSVVKLLNNFEGVCEVWKLYSEAIQMDDGEAQQRILLEDTRGGIIDTGTSIIDIQTIATMYPLYRMAHDDQETKKINKFKLNEIDKFLYGEGQIIEIEDD